MFKGLLSGILLAGLLTSCGNESQEMSEERRERIETLGKLYKEEKSTLQEAYDAALFPPKEFAERLVFTETLQRFLLQSEGKPVIIKCLVDDVVDSEDGLMLHATAFFSSRTGSDNRRLALKLRARRDDLSPLLSLYQDPIESCCCCGIPRPLVYLVARVSSAGRVREPSERQKLGYAAEYTDLYHASGELVALKRLPRS